MSAMLAKQVAQARAARDQARSACDDRIASLMADHEKRGIGGRIADEVSGQAQAMFEEAATIIEDHPGAVGGTIAALVLWFLRNPIMAWLERLVGAESRERGDDHDIEQG